MRAKQQGQIKSVADAKGNITHYGYDACGNLNKITDSLGNITHYEYDALNNRIKEYGLSENGETMLCPTIYQYDKKGRMIKEINPLSYEKCYTYDGNGNIVTILDEDGNETKAMYDLNNQPVNMLYSDGKEAKFRYNKRGELIELQDWNGTSSMEYDHVGHLTKATDHNGHMTGYTYDGNGNIITIAYPDGSKAEYGYTKDNRLNKVTDAEKETTQYSYSPAGSLISVTGPKTTTNYTYNALHLPTQAVYRLADGTSLQENFTYDAIGNITKTERSGSSEGFFHSAEYTYDALGQLITCKEGPQTESYGYDILGNRTLKSRNGKPEAAYTYNALNQLTQRTENGISFGYGYDKRGNLTEERCGDRIVKKYLYDATNHMKLGQNIESGEKSEYTYNALYMRTKNLQTRKRNSSGYQNTQEQSGSQSPFETREISYVTDYLSPTNNELLTYEKDFGTTRVTYGAGYERLNQKISLTPETVLTPRANIAGNVIGKTYFQSDLYASPMLASNAQGEVLRYVKRSAWGNPLYPMQEDLNAAGVENSLLFTNYTYDPVMETYFAQARLYDANQGRMLGKDPIKRGLNAYPYCDNNPVNYVDPTGEIANILAGGLLGGLVGGLGGLAGSALSQLKNGETFDAKKALGSAANGAIVGATRGALLGSGVGIPAAFAWNLGAGALGNAIEQKIGKGNIDYGEAAIGGLSNAMSGLFDGNKLPGSLLEAMGRGAGAGATTAAINSLSNSWKNGYGEKQSAALRNNNGRIIGSPYICGGDPRGGCGNASSTYAGNIGARKGTGYQYETSSSSKSNKRGFDLKGFLGDVALGAVIGAGANGLFYGVGKGVEKVQRSIKGGSSTSYQYNMIENPGPLAEMPNNPAANFASGKYNREILAQDRVYYRAGESGNPYGQWFTSNPANSAIQVRMDIAVKPQWINPNTGVLGGHSYVNTNYAINIPKGTAVYTGPVGYQGGAYLGGQDIVQSFISKPWNIPGVKVVGSTPLH